MAKAPTQTLRVLRLPCQGEPTIETIPHTLEALQSAVGGNVEVYPVTLPGGLAICDDEFLYHGKPFNRFATMLRCPGVADIYGDVLLLRDTPGEFGSLTGEQVHMLKNLFRLFFGIDLKEN